MNIEGRGESTNPADAVNAARNKESVKWSFYANQFNRHGEILNGTDLTSGQVGAIRGLLGASDSAEASRHNVRWLDAMFRAEVPETVILKLLREKQTIDKEEERTLPIPEGHVNTAENTVGESVALEEVVRPGSPYQEAQARISEHFIMERNVDDELDKSGLDLEHPINKLLVDTGRVYEEQRFVAALLDHPDVSLETAIEIWDRAKQRE